MNSTIKAVIAIVAVLIISGAAYYAFNTQITVPEEEQQPAGGSLIEQKKDAQPTGNIDNSVDAIMDSALSEKDILDEEDTDNSVVTSDDQAISELGQLYDEKELQ